MPHTAVPSRRTINPGRPTDPARSMSPALTRPRSVSSATKVETVALFSPVAREDAVPDWK